MSLRNVKVTGVEAVRYTNLTQMTSISGRTKYVVRYHYTPIVPKAKHNGTFELYYDLWADDELDAWKIFKDNMRLQGREVVP